MCLEYNKLNKIKIVSESAKGHGNQQSVLLLWPHTTKAICYFFGRDSGGTNPDRR